MLQHQVVHQLCSCQYLFVFWRNIAFKRLGSDLDLAFNIFTDVCFATLPIPIIWVLQMKLRTRVYLIVVLSLGYL